jgi:hypothetical protein
MWNSSKSSHNNQSFLSRLRKKGHVPQPLQADAGSPATGNDDGPEATKIHPETARPPTSGRAQEMSGDPISERSRHWKTPGALSSEDTKSEYNPQRGPTRRLHHHSSSPSSSRTNQSESQSKRPPHQATGRNNTLISSEEDLAKATIQAGRRIVTTSKDIPETEAEAEAHIQAIRLEKREHDGGRNVKDLEAALEL